MQATTQGALGALEQFESRSAIVRQLEAAAVPFSTHPTPAARRKALEEAVAAGLP